MSKARLLFVTLTLALVAIFGYAMWKDAARDWVHYQQRFARSLKGDERKAAPNGIQQTVIPSLKRIDRCMTCHVAIDKPQLALAEQPFTAHPGKYLEWHPIEKFGCTSCHDGQGLATTVTAAHGEVKHWEDPLLRGPLVQASCGRCHGNISEIAAPLLVQGKQLVAEKGCYGCHTIKGFGGTISQDLSDVGSKPLLQIDFTFVEGPATRANWLMQKFKNPQRVEPGHPEEQPPIPPSAMPNFGFTDEEAQALTAYMLSLTGEDLPVSYVVPATPEPPAPTYASSIEAGHAVFKKYGCAACHGIDGRGGRRNWNSATIQEEPPLINVRHGYTKDELVAFIKRGSQPLAKLDPHGAVPPLYMPAWGERISERELNDLADYLLSLAPAESSSIQ